MPATHFILPGRSVGILLRTLRRAAGAGSIRFGSASSLRDVSVGTLTREARGPGSGTAARAFPLDRDSVLLVLLIALAAVLRFALIGHQGFWFDEANTSQEVHYSPGEMLTLLKHYESTPPFYYAIAWVWARIFGFSEVGLRSLSAICGVLVVPLAYVLADKLISRRAALITAALTACNPLLIWYSQEARAYEMAILLAAASLLAFVYALENPTPRIVAAWVIASGLTVSTEYYSVLVVVPEALWLLYVHRRARPVQLGIGVLGLWSLPLLWFAISQNGTGHASWIAPIPLGPRIGQIFPQFAIGFEAPAAGILSRVDEVVAIVALGLLAWDAQERRKPGVRLLAALLLAGVVINVLLVAVGIDNLLTRNVVALWLPLAILVAAGLTLRRLRVAGLALAAVLCGTGVAAAIGVDVHRSYQRPDWRAVVRVIGPRPAPGVSQRAILAQDYRDVLPLSLYMPGLRSWKHHGTDKYSVYVGTYPISEFDVIALNSPTAPSTGCWWGSACNLTGSQLEQRYSLPGFHVVWIRHVDQFTIMRLAASRPVPLTPALVSSALTNTKLIYDDLLVQR